MKWDKDIMFAILGKGLAFSFNFHDVLLKELIGETKNFKVSVKLKSFSQMDFELMKLYVQMSGSLIRKDRNELESFLQLFEVIEEIKIDGHVLDLSELTLASKQHHLSVCFLGLQYLALPDLKKK